MASAAKRSRAYIGPYFADNFGFENGDEICPWCIADGRAARDWNATFIPWPSCPMRLAARHRRSRWRSSSSERRRSFASSREQWLDHHGEAAAYIGPIGYDGDGPTAKLFRCLHCGWHGAFVATGA